MSNNILEQIKGITLYTGTLGKRGCTCNCIGCTQDNYWKRTKSHQGTLEQITAIMNKLPNLKEAYILGNPDISVDTEFCNNAAKLFIQKNIKVMFSTSGFNGLETMQKLLDGIDPKFVKYISFSVDSINEKTNCYLKGSNIISIKHIESAIKYLQNLEIPVKIQPTLWEINQDDYTVLIKYFNDNYKIDWFTFHCGSFESLINKNIPLKHIQPQKWKEIVFNIQKLAKEKKLRVLIPRLFLNSNEFKEYKTHYSTYCSIGGNNLQVWMEDNFLRATFCPLLFEINPKYSFPLDADANIKYITKNITCPICHYCIDKELLKSSYAEKGKIFKTESGTLYNVCRFYSIRYNY